MMKGKKKSKDILNRTNSALMKEYEHVVQYRNGNQEAYQMLMALCASRIRLTVKQYANCGVPQEDLEQEAHIGLLYAIERYDPKFNVRFVTYASYWIRQAVLDAINKVGNFIYLPKDVLRKRQRIIRMANLICLMSGQEATAVQIAESLGMEETEVQDILKYTIILKPIENLGEKFEVVDSEESITDALLSTLPSLERTVMELRYGVFGEVKSKAFVGDLLGITPERVRQIEKYALKKLRHPARKKGLEGLW